MTKRPGNYEVGYGKPPKHTRWTKGQSGNPGGREKGHKGLRTDLEAALNTINTVENKMTGAKVKGRNQQLAISRLVERAALGDIKAQALLFPMIMQVLGAEDRHQGPKKLSAVDQAIFAEVLGQRLRKASDGDRLLHWLIEPLGDGAGQLVDCRCPHALVLHTEPKLGPGGG